MSWPFFLVWDKYQADFISNVAINRPRIEVVGSIPFSSNGQVLSKIPNRTIAVFDVQPVRNILYKSLGIEFDYYTPEVANQFLCDVYELLMAHHYNMALKRKRNIGKLIHPSYRRILEELDTSSSFISISSEIDASSLIDKSLAVISAPYTSTALIARERNIPSVYYDASGLLERNDPAAHGILLIQGKQKLAKWLQQIRFSNQEAKSNNSLRLFLD